MSDLDSEATPFPLDDFERWVQEALDDLPPHIADRLSNLEVMVAERPTLHQRKKLIPGIVLYGLYEGIPLTKRSSTSYSAVEPDRITIFAYSLRRDFPDADALRAQVRHTVYHEIAHHFGIDDHRLHELGAY